MGPYYDDERNKDDDYYGGTTFAAQRKAAELRERGIEVHDDGGGYYSTSNGTITPDGQYIMDM